MDMNNPTDKLTENAIYDSDIIGLIILPMLTRGTRGPGLNDAGVIGHQGFYHDLLWHVLAIIAQHQPDVCDLRC